MDGANKSFIAGKSTWLRTNLIVYSVGQRGSTSDNPFNDEPTLAKTPLPVYELDLRKIPAIPGVRTDVAGQYELRGFTNDGRTPTPRANPIKAYFLPWKAGETFCGKLGLDADFFFTPTLNGCTFAYDGSGPTPSVAHSNFVNRDTGLVDQTAMDDDLKAKFGGVAPTSKFVKAMYKMTPRTQTEDYKATVIGIRSGNNWMFYYQNYTTDLIPVPGEGSKFVNEPKSPVKDNLCIQIW